VQIECYYNYYYVGDMPIILTIIKLELKNWD